jgi:hypothetical protein
MKLDEFTKKQQMIDDQANELARKETVKAALVGTGAARVITQLLATKDDWKAARDLAKQQADCKPQAKGIYTTIAPLAPDIAKMIDVTATQMDATEVKLNDNQPMLASRAADDAVNILDAARRALANRIEVGKASTFTIAPVYGFVAGMGLWTVLLNGWGLWKLRVWNPSGEPIIQRDKPVEKKEELEEKDRMAAHAAPGKVRQVGANPILWREIYTRAYGRRPLLVKLAYFLVLAFICVPALSPLFTGGARPAFAAAYGLIPVGVLTLLLVAAQAVTAITSERDTGALDLLLVTDLTPKEFIFGKLGGICYNTKEFLVPPLLLAALYAWFGALAVPPTGHPELRHGMNIVSLVCIVGAALVLLAFAMVLGVHVALRTQNSRLAITNALSTIFFLSAGTIVCITLIVINRRFEYQWGSFVFFIVAGIGGLWWVLNGERPATALLVGSIACPLSVLYTVMSILVAKPGSEESADPIVPFLVVVAAFGFTVIAMLVPMLSEFDVALGRTSGGAD